MKLFKALLAFILILFIVYVFITGFVNYYLYKNKSTLENTVNRTLGTQSVNIEKFFNIPGIYMDLINLHIQDKTLGDISIKKIRFHYNILKIPFKGFPSAVSSIAVNKVRLDSNLSNIAVYLENLQNNWIATMTNNISLEGMDVRFSLKDFSSKIQISGPFYSEVKFDRLRGFLSKSKIYFNTFVDINIKSSNQINGLQAGVGLEMNLNLSNREGYGTLKLSNVNMGSVSLLRNEKIGFSISNKARPDYQNTGAANVLEEVNGKLSINFDKEFEMNNPQSNNVFPLLQLLENGKYRLNFYSEIENGKFNFRTSVHSITNIKDSRVDINAESIDDYFLIKGSIDAKKYGKADYDLRISKTDFMPSGTINLKNFTVIEGLKIGGDFILTSESNSCLISGRDASLNGGLVGSASTLLSMVSNKIIFLAPDKNNNAVLEGFAGESGYNLDVQARDIPGSTTVSNIRFNFLKIGNGVYYGNMNVTNDEKMFPVITADIEGYQKPKEDGGQRYIEVSLKYKSSILSFSKIFFPLQNLNLTGDFRFSSLVNSQGSIQINGNADYSGKYILPIKGKINYIIDTEKVSSKFIIDNNVGIVIETAGNSANVKINTDKYSLTNIGLKGEITSEMSLSLMDGLIESLKINNQYKLSGRAFNLYMRAEKENEGLDIKSFMLDTGDEKVIGNGRIFQRGESLSGSVDLLDRGIISFSMTYNEINAYIDIRNLYIKKFFRENLDVFASTRLSLTGSLFNPDITGTLHIQNDANSDEFLLDVPSLSKKGDYWKAKNLAIKYGDYDGEISVQLHSAKDDFSLSSDGNFTIYQIFKGNYYFYYYSNINQASLIYRLSSLKLGERAINDISGEVVYKNNRYQFNQNGRTGLSGFYYSANDYKDWNIDFMENDINVAFHGSVETNNMHQMLSVKSPMEVLSFIKILKDIKGQGSIN